MAHIGSDPEISEAIEQEINRHAAVTHLEAVWKAEGIEGVSYVLQQIFGASAGKAASLAIGASIFAKKEQTS